RSQPFVGEAAFAHTAGMVVSGMRKLPEYYEHVRPEDVGNRRRLLVGGLPDLGLLKEKLTRFGLQVDNETVAMLLRSLDKLRDRAPREALLPTYKRLDDVVLRTYSVCALNGEVGTASRVRVLLESYDAVHDRSWGSVAVSEDIVQASWSALVDALEFKRLLDV